MMMRGWDMTDEMMHIVYASDGNYAPILGISLTSLLENNRDAQLQVHILDSGIPMILVPAESYEEDAAVWNEKIAASGYARSHGIRAVYKKEKEKTDG